ncbi:DUF3558 domain-containing protein [Actinopolyspora lacussalsi]
MACSGGSAPESPGSEERSAESSASRNAAGPEIANPKDATTAKVCELLPAEAARELGLQPRGETPEGNLTLPDEAADRCVWKSSYGATSVSLTPLAGRSIQQYYDNPQSYVDFKKLNIAGYPAVRANRDDPMSGGSCDIFLATKQNQVVKSYWRLNAADTGEVDPCGNAKKALRLSVSSWPAAK